MLQAAPQRSGVFSVVVPCFNEEAVIRHTYDRLVEVLEETDNSFELIFVDDGSRDETWQLLSEIQAQDDRVEVIGFSRNFGHQMAVTAGVDCAHGDAVGLIDADLQDPPEVLVEMFRQWQQGVDVAYGARSDREGESAFKLWTAKLFYRLLNRLSDTKMPLDTGDFRVMDRRVVEVLRQMPERDRFIRGMVSWVGFNQAAVPYHRAARFAGESKYPLWKMVRFATDGLLSFSLVPLKVATGFGLLAAGLAGGGIVYALAKRLFTGDWVSGWTSIFIAVLFVGAVQLLCLGAIGEYLGRLYFQTKGRPLYIVQRHLTGRHAAERGGSGVTPGSVAWANNSTQRDGSAVPSQR